MILCHYSREISVVRPAARCLPLVLLILFGTLGCEAWDVRDVRMNPTYICNGDAVVPTLTWTYGGPDAEADILSAGGKSLCRGGRVLARPGVCDFAEGVTKDDLPFTVKAYVNGEEKHAQTLDENLFKILSGPEKTEIFRAHVTFAPERVPTDAGISIVQRARIATWDLHAEWFSSPEKVQTRKVINPGGGGGCGGTMPVNPLAALVGPGLDAAAALSVGETLVGNNKSPQGMWTETFAKPLEIPGDTPITDTRGYVYNLQLEIACKDGP